MINNLIQCEFPFSHAVVDNNFDVIEFNEEFNKEFTPKENSDEKFKITNLIDNFNFELKKQKAVIRQKCYSVYVSEIQNEEQEIYNVFFIANNCNGNEGCDFNNIVVSLIFIDNYQEVLDSVEEVRHPLLVAVIDRKINKMAYDLSGIVRKFEKDKYIFIFSKDKLDYLKENKFPITESVREIDMGNNFPVTLSIGIGMNGNSLAQSMEFARAAVDLALSRGGDQVLMKDNDKFFFFGGNSKEVGPNNRVRARVKAYALTELIEEASEVLVMGHKNADLDSLGAALGVHFIATALQKNCKIVLNRVSTSIDALYESIIEEDKYEDAFINDAEAVKLVTPRTLLIVVDTHIPSICESPGLLDMVKNIVIFDHHRKSTEAIEGAVLTYHEPFASSACELITEMFLYINRNIKLNSIISDALLAGITVDTKNFVLRTGTKTFEAAAYLKRNGADTVRVRSFFKSSMDLYMLKANTVANSEIFNENMALSVLNSKTENPMLLAAQAADELLSISDIEASFVLCKVGDYICVSARSLESINVQVIMEKLGGGGHKSVAAAQIESDNVNEVINLLKQAINETL